MPVYPKAGISLDVDSSDWDSAYKTVLKEAGNLDSLAPSVKISVNDSEVGTAYASLLDLDRTAAVKINVQDSDLKTAQSTVNDIDSATPNVKVNADASELDAIKEKLDQIRNLSIINIVMSFDQSQIENLPIIGTLVEIDNLTKLITGRVGREIPGAAGIINSLYVQAWGDSKEQIADLIIELDRAGVATSDLEKSATDVFEAAAVSGQDPIEVFSRMDTLVKNGIVPSLSAAADFIAGGFQAGLGRGGDFLDTIDEYSQILADAGLSADGFFNILNSGQDAGVRNTDKLADAYKEFFNLTKEETGRLNEFGETTDRTQALDLLGLGDEAALYTQGKITGDAFAGGVLDGLREIEDTEEQRTRALALFGPSMVEDVGLPGLLAADLNSTEGEQAWQGAADTGATVINETIGVAITELQRTIETELATALDETFDLSGRLETARLQFQTFIDELQGGKTVGDAIEIAFGIDGVDTALTNIERVFGNLTIGILQAVSLIQQLQGVDNSGTKAEIGRLAKGQLAFDLQVANADEVTALISQAIARGVSLDDTWAGLETAAAESLASGDFAQTLNILDGFVQHATANGASPEAIASFTDQFTGQLQTAFDTSIESGDFDVAKKIADAQDDPTAYTDALKGKFGFDAAAFDQMAADFTAGMETAIAAETPTPDMAWASLWKVPEEVNTSFTGLETDVDTALTNAALITGLASQEMIDAMSAITDGVTTADEQIAMAITGNTMTASFDAMSVSAAVNAEATKASFTGILATVSSVDARLSLFFNGVMAKVGAVNDAINGIGTVPTGGGGSTTNNNIVVNTNNNVQSGAQATALGYELGAQVRGMV